MRDVAVLAIHLVFTLISLLRPGGLRSVVAETLLVKHQLLVMNRSRQRSPNLRTADRLLMGIWAGLMRPTRLVRSAIIVQPATLLKFHRALKQRKYRLLFTPERRGKPGPKGPSPELIAAILEMKRRNPRWGCPRIAQQISLAFDVSIDKDVVRRVLAKHYRPDPRTSGPSWLTFLGHSKDSLWCVDLFRCESATLRSHWVLVVMDHCTRRIIGFGVHAGIVDGVALCRMFNRAICRTAMPKYLSSDHDPLYRFHRWQANLRVLGVTEVKTIPYVPLSHPFVERLIGTIRREYLDHVLFWSGIDLERKLYEFQAYYNENRTHTALAGKPPAVAVGETKAKTLSLAKYRLRTTRAGRSRDRQPAVSCAGKAQFRYYSAAELGVAQKGTIIMKIAHTLIAILALSAPLHAQLPPPTADDAHAFKKMTSFSPYAGRNFPTRVYWGDTHLHTSQSMDAGSFGARLMPEDAHRFARGEEVISTGGLKVKLSRPLDFLVVADHSDNLGFFPALLAGDTKMLAHPLGRKWYQMIQEGGQTGVAAGLEIVLSAAAGEMPEELAVSPKSDRFRSAWERTVAAAEKYNEPGRYTALHGYEWTSMPGGDNLHRVVIYRDGGDQARMMMPYTVVPPLGSDDPRDLWEWMSAYEEKTGGSVLALAHNGNLSNGQMFPMVESFNGKPVDADYVRDRIRWEPLYEITQIKGDGETHSFLSPNDEFADYETWDAGNIGTDAKTNEMLPFEYARNALGLGIQLEQKHGINPYKFGFVGSTDSHTGLATAQEDNFFGKHSAVEPEPERLKHPAFTIDDQVFPSSIMASSGLAAVWARENTREALFDALKNKETYATTGSRITVRFFGGWDFTNADAQHRLPANIGYEKGVPMGGDLMKGPAGKAPSFLVAALRDPYSGNLDRIQIVKVWVDASGKNYEKVFNVVWSGDRRIRADGTLPKVGNTVDVANATWTNTIGSSELITVWTDPEFDPKIGAAYYARVLEIPTPRWTAYEAKRFGIEVEDETPMITVERAYTSPIWYTP